MKINLKLMNYAMMQNIILRGNVENIEKKWKSLNKIFNDKNLSRKECILLPFKTIKKIVSK